MTSLCNEELQEALGALNDEDSATVFVSSECYGKIYYRQNEVNLPKSP